MISNTIDLYQLTPEVRSLITEELDKDEELTWIGQPIPKLFTSQSLPVFLFAIPWTAFAIFWMVGASGFEIPDFKDGFDSFFLFGIPFVLIGLAMLSSPFWLRRRARRTYYVLSTDRAIVFMGGFMGSLATSVRSFYPDQLNNLRRTQKSDGSGNLIFTVDVSRSSEGQGTTDVGFISVAEVKAVEDAVRDLVEAASADTE